MELIHVAHDIVPAVLFREEAQLLLVFGGLAVAEVVVCDDDKAVIGQKLHEWGVTIDMLGDAVRDLQNGADFAVRVHSLANTLCFPSVDKNLKS